MSYDVFISYAHKDNSRDQVRELRDAIVQDFNKFAGRELSIFFDVDDIRSMADWEDRIARGLRESRIFLAVLSPSYFASEFCRREWEEYVRYEAMRQCLGEGVAPVYFVELPGLDGPGVEQSIAAAVDEMRKRQWCDLASQKPVKIVRWHDAGKRALEDAHVAERLQTLKGEIKERLSRAERTRQSLSNIYRHNPQFVGRFRELTLLREALNERGSVGVVGLRTQPAAGTSATAVHGLGGMGKTELALAYAHAFAWDYPGGRWLARCEGLDNFDLVLHQLAEPLAVEFTEDEQKDARRAGDRILAELRRRDRSLLLLDNVTHSELLGPDVLMRLPPQGHVHLLATTRLGPTQLAGSPHDHTFVAVDELPADDALALIRGHQPDARFANDAQEAAARDLVALLDGFTLAVETAAIYLGRHTAHNAIAGYTERLRLELLAESEKSAADPSVAVRHKEKLLEHTLAVTFETLSAEQLHVLTLAALLPADQIALPWLCAVGSEKFPILKPGSEPAADTTWQQLGDPLLSLRLFQSAGDARVVRMHRLVQELMRKNAPDTATIEPALLAHVESRAEFLWEAWVQHEHRWELGPLAACASRWMERGIPEGTYLASQACGPLRRLSNFAEAEALARSALTIREQSLGPDDPEVAKNLNLLAVLLLDTNRLAEAEPLMRRALAIDEKSLGANHTNTATRLGTLAQLLKKTNRLAEAEPLMRRALVIEEQSFGPDHPSVATALNNLAVLLEDTNRPTEAEPLMHRALAIDERNFGPDHPNVAVRLGNVAALLESTNRLEEAEPLMRRALAIDERSLGQDHPVIAKDLNNLAQLLQAANRLAEAEPLMHRVANIFEKRLGPDHPNVATALNNLALLLRKTNRLAEAEPLMRRALAIDERSFGSDHPDVARDLNSLAVLLKETNRLAEAEPLMRRVVDIFEKSLGGDHPHLAIALHNLAQLLEVVNRFAEGEPLIRRALAIDEQSFGPEHPNVASDLNILAQVLQGATRLAEAEPVIRRALAIDEQSFGPEHPNVASDLNILAQVLQGATRLAEAEPVIRRALAIDEDSLGPDDPSVAMDLHILAQLLYATNRLAEGERLMRRAVENLLRFTCDTGHQHPSLRAFIGNYTSLLEQMGYNQAQVMAELNNIGGPFGIQFESAS